MQNSCKKIALHSVYTENSAILATYIDSVKVGSEIITAAAYQYIPPQFTTLAREGGRTAIPAATLSRASSDNSTLADHGRNFQFVVVVICNCEHIRIEIV